MEVKISMVINSHLSDALIEINHNPELAAARIRFVRRLMMLTSSGEIGPEVPKEFLNRLWQDVNSPINEEI
jgi:hypothetical protein